MANKTIKEKIKLPDALKLLVIQMEMGWMGRTIEDIIALDKNCTTVINSEGDLCPAVERRQLKII